MCEKLKGVHNRIDKCMNKLIQNLNLAFRPNFKTVACCCGHGKYPMTIVIKSGFGVYELMSGKPIFRKRKFYKKDKQGHYYIPEVTNI